MSRRSVVVTVAVLAVLLAAVPALAGKPGSGATLTMSPNDAPAWGQVTASGCGYEAGTVIYLDVHKPGALAFYGAMPDAGGCFSLTISTDAPGTYHVETRQQLSNGKKWTTMATYDLPVV